MSSSLSYSVDINRDSIVYDLHIEYFITGYSDPETGEYLGDTTWNLTYTRIPPGGGGGGLSGFASESDSITAGLLLDYTPGLFHYRMDFKAWNTFSGDLSPLLATWDVFNAAFATASQTIIAADTTDIILGGSADDVIRALGGNDVVDGGDGDDIIDGGAGSDTINGNVGDDIMLGGAGDDFYTVNSTGDLVVERANEGFDTIIAPITFTLPDNVEALRLVEAENLNGTGNSGDNQIIGNSVVNSLYGLDGNDILSGLGGNDKLYGGGGNDTLDGGTGDDAMYGGAGNDTYWINSRKDRPIETAGGGRDKAVVFLLPSYTLGAELEDLLANVITNFHGIGNTLNNIIEGGAYNDVLEGAAGNDELRGNSGNDTLIGGPGSDKLSGGDGIDTASYVSSAAAVTVNLGTGKGASGDAQGDGYLGVENVRGSNGADTLTGNALANTLAGGLGADIISGGDGNDVIIGGTDGDTLDGGTGIDTVSYAGSTAGAVTVDLGQQLGTATGGDAAGDTISNFENLIGGSGGDTLTGDDGVNGIQGGAGNDTINGAGGNDVIAGGVGNDTMDGGTGNDTVSYVGSVGAVTVNLALQTVHGGDAQGDTISNFESARGGKGDDTLTGTATANTLSGDAGADTINGGDGNDIIIGGAGGDTLDGGDGNDVLNYAASPGGVSVDLINQLVSGGDASGDTIANFESAIGSNFSDYMLGNDANNRFIGGGGFDYLVGGRGNDRLTGGDDTDNFAFATGDGHDIITDFAAGLGSFETISFLLGSNFDSFSKLMAVAKATGSSLQDTIFRFDSHTSLTLNGVKPGDLTDNNFQFVS